MHWDGKPSQNSGATEETKQRSTKSQNFSAIWLHRISLGDARIVSSHLLIGSINQARATNVVFHLICAGSCGKAEARTRYTVKVDSIESEADMTLNWLLLFCGAKTSSVLSSGTRFSRSATGFTGVSCPTGHCENEGRIVTSMRTEICSSSCSRVVLTIVESRYINDLAVVETQLLVVLTHGRNHGVHRVHNFHHCMGQIFSQASRSALVMPPLIPSGYHKSYRAFVAYQRE